MSEPEPGDRPVVEREGGDPACWLGQVCPECGRFTEQDSPKRPTSWPYARTDGQDVGLCPNCGAEMPAE